jgi:hypothetical protein
LPDGRSFISTLDNAEVVLEELFGLDSGGDSVGAFAGFEGRLAAENIDIDVAGEGFAEVGFEDEGGGESQGALLDGIQEDDKESAQETPDEDEDDEMDDEDWKRRGKRGAAEISISFGGMGESQQERMIPKRHNMKKESSEVKKFVNRHQLTFRFLHLLFGRVLLRCGIVPAIIRPCRPRSTNLLVNRVEIKRWSAVPLVPILRPTHPRFKVKALVAAVPDKCRKRIVPAAISAPALRVNLKQLDRRITAALPV